MSLAASEDNFYFCRPAGPTALVAYFLKSVRVLPLVARAVRLISYSDVRGLLTDTVLLLRCH